MLNIILTHAQLVIARRRAHVNELWNPSLEFIEPQRSIVQSGGQPETVLDQRHLARAIALVHTANLRHSHMTLIYDAEHVLGEVVDEGEGGLAGLSAIKMARVVFNARRETHGLQHFEIVARPLFQPLRLKKLVVGFKLCHALFKLLFD